ncbi:MAG: TonB-dependent receptor [Bacteroidales bacterium]|jgi:TonB-linked SusC/RagA family outer membrane protein|nr:TonB-dependent receptor [Bacteroidales bacterium]
MKKSSKALLLTLLLLIANTLFAKEPSNATSSQQQYTEFKVSGNITSKTDGELLPTVNVLEQGTGNGTVSDFDGNFLLEVSNENAVLKFSFLGFKTQTIELNGRSTINIVLEEDIANLDEFIDEGYGVQRKADVTGAISSVKADEINSLPVNNVASAMQGRAAGVQVVSNSGSPGAGVSIKIRGTGTINNSEPLYVVDGFVMDNIDYLNPNDIADLQVLKDASSSAIYGARAANGVVIVTTKSGTEGKIKINADYYYGVSDFWSRPDVMDKVEYSDLYYAGNGGSPLVVGQQDSIKYNDYAANNWLDLVTRQGTTQKANVSISGGNDKTKYMFSGLYSKEEGIVLKSSQQRASFRANIESKLTDFLTIKFNSMYTNSNREYITEGNSNIFQYALSTPPSNTIQPDDAFNWVGNNLVSVDDAIDWNPYARLWYADQAKEYNNFVNNVDLTFDLFDGMTFSSRAGIVNCFSKQTTFNKRHNPASNVYFDDIKYDDNTYQEIREESTKWQVENILMYNKAIGSHNVGLVTALALEGYRWDRIAARKSMAPGYSDEYHSLDAAYLSAIAYGGNSDWTSVGIPFRFDYNFQRKYYFQFNFRADASSIFSEDNQWGFFPSVSTGWTLSEEPFMKGFDWLSMLKIRANWGMSGNNRIDEFASNTILSTSNSSTYVYGRSNTYKPGWSASGYGNPNILWEKTAATNLGIDFVLLDSRFTGAVEYFVRNTSDMLLQLPLTLSTGMNGNEPWQNAGEISNKGYEMTLGYNEIIGDFKLSVNGNISRVVNEVTKLGSEGNPVWGGYLDVTGFDGVYSTYTAVGNPIGQFYGWKIDRSKYANGIFHESDRENIPNSAVPDVRAKPGDFIFMDLNGDNKIDENDKTFIGDPNPDFTYGLNINLSYKHWDLTAFFQGVYGNDIFNATQYYMSGYHGDNNASTGLVENSYTIDNQDAKYPMITNVSDYNQNYRISDFYVEDGSYLRLKNIQLAYNFKHKFKEDTEANVKVYMGVTNLFTITKYSGFDPEIGNESNTFMGIDRGAYPQSRTVIAGIILNL